MRFAGLIFCCCMLCGCATLEEGGPFAVDVDTRDEDGSTPLMKAVLVGNRFFVETLLSHGADVNARNNFGITPLMIAAFADQNEIAQVLVEHGADVNALVDGENIALTLARSKGNAALVQMLVRAGARDKKPAAATPAGRVKKPGGQRNRHML